MRQEQRKQEQTMQALLSLLVVSIPICVIGFAYGSLFVWLRPKLHETEALWSHIAICVWLLPCIFIGGYLWRKLRPHTRLAALLGLGLTALLFMGVPLGANILFGVGPSFDKPLDERIFEVNDT